jgi:hypothetical protein
MLCLPSGLGTENFEAKIREGDAAGDNHDISLPFWIILWSFYSRRTYTSHPDGWE